MAIFFFVGINVCIYSFTKAVKTGYKVDIKPYKLFKSADEGRINTCWTNCLIGCWSWTNQQTKEKLLDGIDANKYILIWINFVNKVLF